MLEKIRLENFKCFERLELPLSTINVFAGVNGAGKSTVLQSLLVLRQSYLEDKLRRGLYLNGRYVRLGNGQDVLCEKLQEEKILIELQDNGRKYRFGFLYSAEDDLQLSETPAAEDIGMLSVFQNHFVYLSAYRVEPQDLYRITNEQNLRDREFGTTGEFAFQYLNQFGNENLKNPHVVISDKAGESLANQVRLWMDMISPGVSPLTRVDRQLRNTEVRYEYIEGRNKTNSFKGVNVGFGVTYVLPIVIALLSAKEDDLIILENPEAHIHPHGQLKLGELIALTGAGGAQVILETHSDHILNGIRIAVKEGRVSAERTNLVYFYKDMEDFVHKIKRPELNSNGRLSEWPDGFMDEWDKALLNLL